MAGSVQTADHNKNDVSWQVFCLFGECEPSAVQPEQERRRKVTETFIDFFFFLSLLYLDMCLNTLSKNSDVQWCSIVRFLVGGGKFSSCKLCGTNSTQ